MTLDQDTVAGIVYSSVRRRLQLLQDGATVHHWVTRGRKWAAKHQRNWKSRQRGRKKKHVFVSGLHHVFGHLLPVYRFVESRNKKNCFPHAAVCDSRSPFSK